MKNVRKKERGYTNDYFLVFDFDSGEIIGRLLNLTTDGLMLISEDPVELNALVDAVKQHMGGAWDLPVFINGDRRSDLGMTVRILDLLKSAGIREVSIETAEEVP